MLLFASQKWRYLKIRRYFCINAYVNGEDSEKSEMDAPPAQFKAL